MLNLRSRAFKNTNFIKIKNVEILLKFIVIHILPSAAWSVSSWIMPLKPNPYHNITSCIMSTVTRSVSPIITRCQCAAVTYHSYKGLNIQLQNMILILGLITDKSNYFRWKHNLGGFHQIYNTIQYKFTHLIL